MASISSANRLNYRYDYNGNLKGIYTSGLKIDNTGSSDYALKIHSHLTTASIVAEYKGETINTSGTFYGVNCEAHIRATGTGSVYGLFGVALVASTFTVTGGTIVGTY
jgi:hypothetical protein